MKWKFIQIQWDLAIKYELIDQISSKTRFLVFLQNSPDCLKSWSRCIFYKPPPQTQGAEAGGLFVFCPTFGYYLCTVTMVQIIIFSKFLVFSSILQFNTAWQKFTGSIFQPSKYIICVLLNFPPHSLQSIWMVQIEFF